MCKKEMICLHTGTKVRYREDRSHIYSGDSFKCNTCGNTITACINPSYHSTTDEESETDIFMDKKNSP